jgi:hypothetical protein
MIKYSFKARAIITAIMFPIYIGLLTAAYIRYNQGYTPAAVVIVLCVIYSFVMAVLKGMTLLLK